MQVEGRFWIKKEGKNFLGHGRVELLENIHRFGSISAAAKAMKMSYKAAWDSVDAMNNLSSVPLVERTTGGQSGGGTRLTSEALNLIASYRKVEAFYQKVFQNLSNEQESLEDTLAFIDRLKMKTSARNQIKGTIVGIQKDQVKAHIVLNVADAFELTADISSRAFFDLGLQVDQSVFFLLKATSVEVVHIQPDNCDGLNCISARIVSVEEGRENVELQLDIAKSGYGVGSIISLEKWHTLKLKRDDEVFVIIRANDMIVAI